MTATEHPWELGPNKSPTQPWESDMTHPWVVTTVEMEMRRPASDPFPQRKTTLRLPFGHSDTNPSRWIPLGPEGWST